MALARFGFFAALFVLSMKVRAEMPGATCEELARGLLFRLEEPSRWKSFKQWAGNRRPYRDNLARMRQSALLKAEKNGNEPLFQFGNFALDDGEFRNLEDFLHRIEAQSG